MYSSNNNNQVNVKKMNPIYKIHNSDPLLALKKHQRPARKVPRGRRAPGSEWGDNVGGGVGSGVMETKKAV